LENILGVSRNDLIFTAAAGFTHTAFLYFIFYKEFMIISFDQVFARAVKIPVEVYRNFLLVLMALTIVSFNSNSLELSYSGNACYTGSFGISSFKKDYRQ